MSESQFTLQGIYALAFDWLLAFGFTNVIVAVFTIALGSQILRLLTGGRYISSSPFETAAHVYGEYRQLEEAPDIESPTKNKNTVPPRDEPSYFYEERPEAAPSLSSSIADVRAQREKW